MELISRKMAIDHIRVLGGEDRERLIGILNNKDILPTVESRPTGTWHQSFWKMPTAREIRWFYYYECDFCKNEVLVERIDGYNYCPHCGARMQE